MSLRYVIVGLGKTGLSCAKFLAVQGLKFGVTDSRSDPPCLTELQQLFPDVPLALGGFDEQMMQLAEELVVSQGISYQEPSIELCRSRGISIIGDIELFARHVRAPVIAITGSNAKSTVTTIVGEMAKATGLRTKIGGNLGTPALDLIEASEPDIYVLEVSNFQLETTYSLAPAVASILNITPDHLDRYHSFNEYVVAKQRSYHGCKHAVINRDDKLTWVSANLNIPTTSFGEDTPAEKQFGLVRYEGQWYLAQGKTLLLAVDNLKIKGKHNWLNALSALAIGHAAGFSMDAMLSVLRTFPGLPHRCEWVRTYRGVDWYNDSKGTNIGATAAAIKGLGGATAGQIVLLAGGLGKGADFHELVTAFNGKVRHVILFGKDANIIADAIGNTVPYTHVDNFPAAVHQAIRVAQVGDAVLLSPACASWDMFNNYEHRGNIFCQLVKELSE
jgi:UDP-N-acetylmuramoylalanine--D-glutamate ligase